jgi:glycosyltransferase involved in cell wall biosynthesis
MEKNACMKLLICTQAVDENDPALGFFVRWIREFAEHVEQVTVLCLREGTYVLPENVRVIRLASSRVSRVFSIWHISVLRRHEYEAVFVHMNPEYLVVAGLLWRFMRKRAVLWYTHKQVDLKLRAAVFFAHVVCTASPASFRLHTRKLRVVGHGINPQPVNARMAATPAVRIVTVGRISDTKRLLEMIDVLAVLHERQLEFSFTIIGAPATAADRSYATRLEKKIQGSPFRKSVHVLGAKPHAEIPEILARADVFLNLSATGSFDKAVLEAVFAGVAPVTTNEAFRELLTPYGLYVPSPDSKSIADAIVRAPTSAIQELKTRVVREHALGSLISRLVSILTPAV